MPTDKTPNDPWRDLVGELQDSRDQQRNAWSDVDDLLIARYLAGECDEQERLVVEDASRRSPEIRECIAMASEALEDVGAHARAYEERNGVAAVGVGSLDYSRASIGARLSRLVFGSALPNWAVAVCLLVAVGLSWALVTQVERLDARFNQVAALHVNREDSTKHSSDAEKTEDTNSLLEDQLERLEDRVAAMSQRSHEEAVLPKVSPPPQKNRNEEEQFVTAVREAQIVRPVPYVSYRPVTEEVADAGGVRRTVRRHVLETACREERVSLPRDLADAPPTPPADDLFALLSHKEGLVRWAAADTLSRISDSDTEAKARTAVIEMLKKRDDHGSAAAEYILSGRIADGFGENLNDSAMKALDSQDKTLCWAALHYFLVVRRCFQDDGLTVTSPTFVEPGSVPRLVELLMKIVRHEGQDPLLCRAAVYLLGQFNDKAKPALDVLLRIVEDDGDPRNRRWAAYAIAQIGTEAHVAASRVGEVLIQEAASTDSKIDETVFPAVAYAYGELCQGKGDSVETRREAEVLIDCLEDTNPNISYWAAYALWRINTPTLSTKGNTTPAYATQPSTYNENPSNSPAPAGDRLTSPTDGRPSPTIVAKPPATVPGNYVPATKWMPIEEPSVDGWRHSHD